MKKVFYSGGFLYNPKTKEVFLHKRDGNTEFNPNKWAFFGGESEEGELPVKTFIREMKEETNYSVEEEDVVFLREYLNKRLNTFRHVFFIESEIKRNELVLGEGEDFRWIKIEDLEKTDLTEKVRADLEFFKKRYLLK